MVNKKEQENPGEKKGRVKIGKLKLNRETIKDLTDSESRQIRGGIGQGPTQKTDPAVCSNPCADSNTPNGCKTTEGNYCSFPCSPRPGADHELF